MAVVRGIARFLKDIRGVAAIEFGILVPIFLLAFLGANYVSALSIANRKMQAASYAIANMAPYPRDYCTYRDYARSAYVSGLQRQVVAEILSPFPITNQDYLLLHEEDPPSGDVVKSRVRMTYDFRVSESENTIYSSLDNIKGLAPSLFQIGVISPDITLSYNGGTCPSDTPLTISGPAFAEFSTGVPGMVVMSASGGVPNYAWSIQGSTLPLGLSINPSNGQISGSAVDNCNTGLCEPATTMIQVRAEDSSDKLWYAKPKQVATHSLALTIVYELRLTAEGGTGTAEVPFVGPAPSRRGGKGGYTYFATGLPTGLSINPSTGVVSGKPTQVGTFSSTISVRDGRNIVASRTVSYTFQAPPFSMTVATTSMTGMVGQPLTPNPITATGGFGGVTITCNGLPPGVSCGGLPREIKGTPTAPGSGTIMVKGTDQAGQSITYPVSYYIAPPPIVANDVSFTFVAGRDTWPTEIPVSGGWGTFTSTCSGLPSGVTCWQKYLGGAPDVNGLGVGPGGPQSGVGQMTLSDSWGQSKTINVYWYLVSPPMTVSFYPGCTMSARQGDYGCSYFQASGGWGPKSIVSITGLPPGYSYSGIPSTGLFWIAGTATSAGSGTMTVTISDTYGSSASYSLPWTILPPPIWGADGGDVAGYPACYRGTGCTYYRYFSFYGGTGMISPYPNYYDILYAYGPNFPARRFDGYTLSWDFTTPYYYWPYGDVYTMRGPRAVIAQTDPDTRLNGEYFYVDYGYGPYMVYGYPPEGSAGGVTVTATAQDAIGQVATATISMAPGNWSNPYCWPGGCSPPGGGGGAGDGGGN